jgi:hypothetical protein
LPNREIASAEGIEIQRCHGKTIEMSQPQHALAPGLIKFAELLDRRLRRGVLRTEDAVRYTFFSGLIETFGISPEDIVIEHPHVKIARAKIDTWIPSFNGRAFAIEFK